MDNNLENCVTTTLNIIKDKVPKTTPSINEDSWKKLLSGISENDGNKPLKFSTIIELAGSCFAFLCLLAITGHDDKLHLLLADIVQRRIYRQRDRLFPNGDFSEKDSEDAKKCINLIREGKFYTDKEGNFLTGSNLVQQIKEDEILNAYDALKNLPDSGRCDVRNFMNPKSIAVRESERKWSGMQLIKYFG